MKVLFTGATGVLGRASVPRLLADAHDVIAVSRSEEEASWLTGIGARPARVDLFDPAAIREAMAGVDTVVHYATAIPAQAKMTKRESWALNDRLRSGATGLLVDAAIAHGVTRFIQQSITFFYADGGDKWLDEMSPIAPGWQVLDSALAAEAHVDRFRSAGGTGVTLRLSRLYGPGPASGEYVSGVASRKIPIIGDGNNFVSSLHVEDAAEALRNALTAPGGVYNVTDDHPVPAAEYTGSLATALGAPTPRRIPRWVGRLAMGKAIALLTTSQRVSNAKFREAAGWEPRYPSVEDGWPAVVERTGSAR